MLKLALIFHYYITIYSTIFHYYVFKLVDQLKYLLDESANPVRDSVLLNDRGSGQKLPSLACPAKHNK